MRSLLLPIVLLITVACHAQGPVPLPPDELLRTEDQDMETEHAGAPTLEEQVADDLFEDAAKARRTARLVSSLGVALNEVMGVIDQGSFQLAGMLDEVGFVVADLFEARAETLERKGRWLLEDL